jgi:hypothetical protein
MDSNTKIVIDDQYTIRFIDYKGDTYCMLKYDPAHNMTITTWSGFIPDEELIKCFKYQAVFCAENKFHVVRGITDLKQNEGSFDGVNKWLAEEYLPRLVKYGFKYTAIVKPLDFYSNLALESQMEITEGLLGMKHFDDYDEAYNWIIHMPD